MSFSNIIKQRNILLIPFSWLYKAGAFVYHRLYDLKILPSHRPAVKTICIGNLSVGGTGKSPMVEYLLRMLTAPDREGAYAFPLEKQKLQVAVLSRGYRRLTKGFVLAGAHTTAQDIGDEPMQFHQKFPEVTIAVDENRAEGINLLLKQKKETDVIILDDAFQHRSVTAGLNILLTEYKNIFTKDWYLPAGSLRDLKSNYKRADIIVVTKCNADTSEAEKQQVISNIKPFSHQKVFFTAIDYGTVYNIFTKQALALKEIEEVVLVTGIANPQPILDYLKEYHIKIRHLQYGDHHHFSESDIGDILGIYRMGDIKNKIILTTEKDAVRLSVWQPLKDAPLFALPVRHRFLFNEGDAFDRIIIKYLYEP